MIHPGSQTSTNVFHNAAEVHTPVARAAKVISTGELSYSTTPMTSRVASQVLNPTTTGCAMAGLGYLQLSNDYGVVSDSMWTALTTVRNGLDTPEAVSTPHPGGFLGYFIMENATQFTSETEFLNLQVVTEPKGDRSMWVHPAFDSLRSRQTFIWAVRIGPRNWRNIADDRNAHWCLVVGEIEARPATVVSRGTTFPYTNRREDFVDLYYDRSIRSIQIFNPLIDDDLNRERTHRLLAREITVMLTRAGIAVHTEQFRFGQAEYGQVTEPWQTGFQCFGIAQEYMRRLNVRANLGLEDTSEEAEQMMRSTYVGLPRISVLRESMIAACATRAVIQSDYKARIAVELPGQGIEADTVAPMAGGGFGEHPQRIDDPDNETPTANIFISVNKGPLPGPLTAWQPTTS
ncbi:hypothetical protein PFICI_06115 [Pestalotiopsis fici W106-1]|uniref:Uncharacterized protein n=1 Tax=Pestalotiopsis fici (strain W106-1 / CGMCC3.15140) TaxID=1229662 RepID=W3X4Q7_PESFW|nr:uncharacterized protein PFICI_06115 [Pestalotiopsis fici W106-1]ETS81113.1 hypothetical protein PFICI_06115 [Pestalotiopsis fici W106-1]